MTHLNILTLPALETPSKYLASPERRAQTARLRQEWQHRRKCRKSAEYISQGPSHARDVSSSLISHCTDRGRINPAVLHARNSLSKNYCTYRSDMRIHARPQFSYPVELPPPKPPRTRPRDDHVIKTLSTMFQSTGSPKDRHFWVHPEWRSERISWCHTHDDPRPRPETTS